MLQFLRPFFFYSCSVVLWKSLKSVGFDRNALSKTVRSQAQWMHHWMSEEILFWSCVSLVPQWVTGHVGEGGVYHTPTVTGSLVEKTEAKEQVHRISNLCFPCLTLSQSPNYASMLPKHEAWRDMILVFPCFLPFRLRIMQLKKRRLF